MTKLTRHRRTTKGAASIATVALVAGLGLSACGSDDSSTQSNTTSTVSSMSSTKPTVEIPDTPAPTTLKTRDIKTGDGAEAKAGDTVTVQYVGVSYSTKKEFDSSYSAGRPFSFQLGAGQVIKGWDQGVAGMKVGGQRELTIPPDLAYGSRGAGGAIGPNETLVFVVDLVSVG